MTLFIIGVYLVLVLFVGALSHRLFRGTGEDYFVASRTIGPFLLLMSLFGTNMTAFSILGASGEAYNRGIGVFGLMGAASAFVIPCVFFVVGTRVWALGKRHGFLTQAQFFRQRWESDALGLLLFVVLVALVVPYLLIGIMGGGITLNQMTDGWVPQWVGGLVIGGVVLLYVCYGGLRGTVWANALQTLVFMTLGAVAFYVIVGKMGGLTEAFDRVAHLKPELLVRGDVIHPVNWLTYTFLPLSAGMFPHIFMHWMTAQRARSFQWPLILYPLCILVVWVPSVVLGVLGHVSFDNLHGPAANSVLVRLIDLHAPGILAGLLAAGVLAAVMSSLDSQVLAIGTMFTQDIVRHYGFNDQMSEKQQVFYGRLFVVVILAITYVISLVSNRSIFGLAVWSFTGFAALFPVMVAAVFWQRSTKEGAFGAILSVAILWIYFFLQGWQTPGYTVGGTGVLPVAVMVVVSSLVLILVSVVTRPPKQETLDAFFTTSQQIGK